MSDYVCVCYFCGKIMEGRKRKFCNKECRDAFYKTNEDAKERCRKVRKKYRKKHKEQFNAYQRSYQHKRYHNFEEDRDKIKTYNRERYRQMSEEEKEVYKERIVKSTKIRREKLNILKKNVLEKEDGMTIVCKFCGKGIIGGRKRKFCDKKCRDAFYHTDEMKKKKREYMERYYQDEEKNKKRKEYMNNYMKEYFQDEEHYKKHRECMKNYQKSLSVEKKREINKKRYAKIGREKNTENFRNYVENNRDKWNAYCRERYHRMKLQKQENENAKEI